MKTKVICILEFRRWFMKLVECCTLWSNKPSCLIFHQTKISADSGSTWNLTSQTTWSQTILNIRPPIFWDYRACNTDPSQNEIRRLFEFLMAYNSILWAPWLAANDILMAINGTPVSVHGIHTMLLHASRNSDGLSFFSILVTMPKAVFTFATWCHKAPLNKALI